MADNQPGRAEAIMRGAEQIRQMNLFNNTFMTTAMRDRAACEYVLRKILHREDLELTFAATQWMLPNLTSKDSYLDVYAENERENEIYNLEDQRKDTKEHARRTRYYGAMIDKSSLDKGRKYHELPDVYIIYISETDIWHLGQTVYEVDHRLRQTGTPYEDGTHRIYVNAAVDDGSEVAKMMQYFKTADPNDMSQGALSRRVRYLKSEKRGEEEMDEVAEWIYNQGDANGEARGRTDEKRETARRLYKRGYDLQSIAEDVDASMEHVREWLETAPEANTLVTKLLRMMNAVRRRAVRKA